MKRIIISSLVSLICLVGTAHEGMWVPSVLKSFLIEDMQEMGMQLSAEDIYSINQSSLKDAIVRFGGGCTGEIISDQGLLLTNHHCGYSSIQRHSSLENNYLKNGFWAMSKEEELSNPGLSATFVVRIEDVTEEVLMGTDTMADSRCEEVIAVRTKDIETRELGKDHYKAEVKPFFFGNQYFLIVTETYEDIRLVGAPPSSIGKFGGDTDNWEWPRHTGDFSLFRVYANSENEPAEFSEDNVPLNPKTSLKIAMDGVQPGEFTMIYGFPYTTDQYLHSRAVKYTIETLNPARIGMREKSLAIIDQAMNNDEKINIMYASKQSSISNAYKKWIGQNMGLKRFDAVGVKKDLEKRFMEEISGNPELMEKYGGVLSDLDEYYTEFIPADLSWRYFIELYYRGPEIMKFTANYLELIDNYEKWKDEDKLEEELKKLRSAAEGYFEDYDSTIDKKIFQVLFPMYLKGPDNEWVPDFSKSVTADPAEYGEELYSNSTFTSPDKLQPLLRDFDKKAFKKLKNDPAVDLARTLVQFRDSVIFPNLRQLKDRESDLMKTYTAGLMEVLPSKARFPDANATLRVGFGKAEGSEPRDGMKYLTYTTLDGVIQKYKPDHPDFDLPQKLLELHEKQDYGNYATNGEMRVCFLGSNHTTGGNSGSPALDAQGRLLGLNFDRTWESTMSDILFRPEICRNIMVDIKYVLFIIDKFAGAGYLVEEMDLAYEQVPARASEKPGEAVEQH